MVAVQQMRKIKKTLGVVSRGLQEQKNTRFRVQGLGVTQRMCVRNKNSFTITWAPPLRVISRRADAKKTKQKKHLSWWINESRRGAIKHSVIKAMPLQNYNI